MTYDVLLAEVVVLKIHEHAELISVGEEVHGAANAGVLASAGDARYWEQNDAAGDGDARRALMQLFAALSVC